MDKEPSSLEEQLHSIEEEYDTSIENNDAEYLERLAKIDTITKDTLLGFAHEKDEEEADDLLKTL